MTGRPLVVIGGGITGAGVALQAARAGWPVRLFERRDFAWGTSSRSSKLVHGGLRYLGQGDVSLTAHSLREREWLLDALPQLVQRRPWLFPLRRGRGPGRWTLKAGLMAYDLLARRFDHHFLTPQQVLRQVPELDPAGLQGGMVYGDAVTDDSRLVLRVLHEARALGATLHNYCGIRSVRRLPGGTFEVTPDEGAPFEADAVINATGAWADCLSGTPPRVRPQRGSHLFFSAERWPLQSCLTLFHPQDGRPVFLFPWRGAVCAGTTDLDHRQPLDQEARMTAEEGEYLFRLLQQTFPQRPPTPDDLVATQAGVRPVIGSGRGVDPSRERRTHAVWNQDGLVTVSGGKLTTFRTIALDALEATGRLSAPALRALRRERRLFGQVPQLPALLEDLNATPGDPGWAEALLWSARHEQVRHLDDLLLRRTRFGLTEADGGVARVQAQSEALCAALGWSSATLEQEVLRYRERLAQDYGRSPLI